MLRLPWFPQATALDPTPAERTRRAIPLFVFLIYLFLQAQVALKFETKFKNMEIGALPVITELFLDISKFILLHPILDFLILTAILFAYLKISRHHLLTYFFNFVLVIFFALYFMLFPLAMFMPMLNTENVCLVSGTLISTPVGPRPIESLHTGDLIYSRNAAGMLETGHVIGRHALKATCYLEFKCQDGAYLKVTSEHPLAEPLPVAKGWAVRWKLAKAFKPGDSLLEASGPVRIESIQEHHESVTVHDLAVDINPNFFASGVLVHNRLCSH